MYKFDSSLNDQLVAKELLKIFPEVETVIRDVMHLSEACEGFLDTLKRGRRVIWNDTAELVALHASADCDTSSNGKTIHCKFNQEMLKIEPFNGDIFKRYTLALSVAMTASREAGEAAKHRCVFTFAPPLSFTSHPDRVKVERLCDKNGQCDLVVVP